MADDPAAALKPVRDRQRLMTDPAAWASSERLTEVLEARRTLVREDVPRLLGALDAVLKLADDATPVERDYGGEPIWWNLTPEEIRKAITSKLTGEESTSG